MSQIEKEFNLTDSDFEWLIGFIHNETGIQIAHSKRDMIYGRLSRRLRDLKMSSFKEYCKLIEKGDSKDELVNFVNAVTTNLTSFFRENHHFAHLKELFSEIYESNPVNKKMRIWSAASSSGPEPYSIAMTARETIKNIDSWDFKILGTDIDTNMLEKCKAGHYEDRFLDGIPPSYFKKYVVKDKQNDSGNMSDSLKKLIIFKQLNLLSHWPMKGMFDVIFCRNVVIYFDKPTQKVLFNRMADLIRPGGYLYIGHSESLFNICDKFELIGKTIYKRKAD